MTKTLDNKTLVIVESPTKANTIARFLGSDYIIDSSFGHIRDLPKSKLGIDCEKNFEPQYVIPTKSRKQVNALKKEVMKVKEIILATDEDREGEAIAYHLVEALDLKDKLAQGDVKRIVFHEITESAIREALSHPRSINMAMVDAQQARRVLDRLVGYKLSPFLWKKVMRGLSAGRVQSVAVRLIVQRESEIKDFKPVEYYTIEVELEAYDKELKKHIITFALAKIGGKAIEKPGMTDKDKVENIILDLPKSVWKIENIIKKDTKRNPLPPFITSTLQQTAVNRLGYSSKKTMMLTQRLYEKGYITYMRTDSVNLSKEATLVASEFITENYGKEYALLKPRKFSQKSKLAQEAHEAIRPTNPKVLSASLNIEPAEKKVYEMIWQRFMASQMQSASITSTTIEALAKGKDKYTFRVSGSIIAFDGFLRVWPTKMQEITLPNIDEKKEVLYKKSSSNQHFTEPPARYNEASLIKALEEHGIGRPSTYASIISVIQDRNYVIKNEVKRFEPTEIGEIVNNLLVEHFPKIVDIGFTSDVEESLDEVALGVSNWREVIKEFYEPFNKNLEKKYEEIQKSEIVPEEKTDKKCPECSKDMIIKRGRFGKFLACSGFPDCKHTEKIEGESGGANTSLFKSVSTGIRCPECGQGELVSRRVGKGRARGKIFWGCNRYPDCKHAVWENPLAEKKEKKEKDA